MHSWHELDWCLANPKLSQVLVPEADLKNAEFKKSKEGRLDGTGYYEYSADLKVYRVHNLIRFGDNDPRYFRAQMPKMSRHPVEQQEKALKTFIKQHPANGDFDGLTLATLRNLIKQYQEARQTYKDFAGDGDFEIGLDYYVERVMHITTDDDSYKVFLQK
jgi:hypothetical protein